MLTDRQTDRHTHTHTDVLITILCHRSRRRSNKLTYLITYGHSTHLLTRPDSWCLKAAVMAVINNEVSGHRRSCCLHQSTLTNNLSAAAACYKPTSQKRSGHHSLPTGLGVSGFWVSTRRPPPSSGGYITSVCNQTPKLVAWSLMSLSTTNMAISETKGQGWRAIPTQWRKASNILTLTLAAFLFSSHPNTERDREAHL